MSDRLTILHLGSDMHSGGSTISIALLARAQRRAGHRVAVGCRAGSGLERAARGSGLETIAIDWDHGASVAARAVARLAAERRADVINAHASRDRAACRRARLFGRLPQALVMTRRVMPRSSWPSAIWSGLAADRMIAVSAAVARALVRRGTPPWKIRVVENAVDWERLEKTPSPDAVRRARELAGARPGRPTIGMVARRKNQDLLLRAVARLNVPVSVCLVGVEEDSKLAPLAAAARERGHDVRCVPFQDDVRPFYSIFDVAVLPSVSEGCPQGLLEAMALGVPVGASREAGSAAGLEDGATGVVCERTPAALARGLARQLLDAEAKNRMAKAARRLVLERFSIERTLAGTMTVYESALALRGGVAERASA